MLLCETPKHAVYARLYAVAVQPRSARGDREHTDARAIRRFCPHRVGAVAKSGGLGVVDVPSGVKRLMYCFACGNRRPNFAVGVQPQMLTAGVVLPAETDHEKLQSGYKL